MHKALAQAWRDLKPEGQKPYFDEYERHKASYTAKVNELRDHNLERGGGDVGRQQRAASVGSSTAAAAPSFDEQAGAGSNTNDEDGDEIMGGAAGDADFSFSSRI
jgi:non-histone protein 10